MLDPPPFAVTLAFGGFALHFCFLLSIFCFRSGVAFWWL